jgi:hypothetical protein
VRPVNKFFEDNAIKQIEVKFNVKYVIDACFPIHGGGWFNNPVAIFYSEQPHPEGSNYMAIHWIDYQDGYVITDGYRAVQGVFDGFLFEDGELVHSRYRHDNFQYRGAMVDGGRDYFRRGSCPEGAKQIKFQIVNGEIKQVVNFEYDTGHVIE